MAKIKKNHRTNSEKKRGTLYVLFATVILVQAFMTANVWKHYSLEIYSVILENEIGMSRQFSSSLTLQLQVPFYVYQEDGLNWENLTFQRADLEDYSNSKHSDDLWFYRAAMTHPRRTENPHEAKLFFVPFLLNAVSEHKSCLPSKNINQSQTVCFKRPGQAYQLANRKLSTSPFFQRSQGRDHIVVISHWLAPLTRRIENILMCNIINFEGQFPIPNEDRFSLPSCYVGRPCHSKGPKTHDFVMVASYRPLPEFAMRENICNWLAEGRYSVSLCGQGNQCPAVPQARFGFHPRGDTWGSNRVIDLFLSRTIPLFTGVEQYSILPDFIPWRNMSYLVNVSSRKAFDESLQFVLSRPPSEYQEKLRLIESYQPFFDHQRVYQFDAYMAKFSESLKLE